MALDDVTGITQTFAEMAPSTPATQAMDLGLQQGQDMAFSIRSGSHAPVKHPDGTPVEGGIQAQAPATPGSSNGFG